MSQELPKLTDKPSFTCITEAEAHPPLDPEADKWFLQARRIQRGEEKGTFAQVQELIDKAIAKGHWKALNAKAVFLSVGDGGYKQDVSEAVDLTERGMKQNIGRSYALMGSMLARGLGVQQDTAAAWAHQRKAAELGVSTAQTEVGNQLFNLRENTYFPEVGEAMLLCAIKQGEARAAFELGLKFSVEGVELFDKDKALKYWQIGLALGSQYAGLFLFSAFRDGDMGLTPDRERYIRYKILRDYLDENPDAKFPSLDIVLPLPPASLPAWNGDEGDLIKRAMQDPEESKRKEMLQAEPPPKPCKSGDTCPRTGLWQPAAPIGSALYSTVQNNNHPRFMRAGEPIIEFGLPSGYEKDITWYWVGEYKG